MRATAAADIGAIESAALHANLAVARRCRNPSL
jgi:hypothetical protein